MCGSTQTKHWRKGCVLVSTEGWMEGRVGNNIGVVGFSFSHWSSVENVDFSTNSHPKSSSRPQPVGESPETQRSARRRRWPSGFKGQTVQTVSESSTGATATAVFFLFFFSFNHGTDRLISPDLFLNKILCTLTVYTENRRVNRSKRSQFFFFFFWREGDEMEEKLLSTRLDDLFLPHYNIWFEVTGFTL